MGEITFDSVWNRVPSLAAESTLQSRYMIEAYQEAGKTLQEICWPQSSSILKSTIVGIQRKQGCRQTNSVCREEKKTLFLLFEVTCDIISLISHKMAFHYLTSTISEISPPFSSALHIQSTNPFSMQWNKVITLIKSSQVIRRSYMMRWLVWWVYKQNKTWFCTCRITW